MTFVSYAQNFEDVMLWRALKHVPHGVYVDVGAQHPVIDSVSKAFYERGWRGIHIEPVPEYAGLLRQDRPDEIVLQVALSDTDGTLQLNVIPDTGLSTAVDAYAERHRSERGGDYTRIQVSVLTLTSALTSLVDRDVHWLKIDVEGLEEKVLRGWDSQSLRPWVMVVEATVPNSAKAEYASWEPILTAADYCFVYFDGLNRFYVANEHPELIEAFSSAPNVFDDVQLGLPTSDLFRGVRTSYEARDKELSTLIEKLASELDIATIKNSKLEIRSKWLLNEWDAAKRRADSLENELALERERSVLAEGLGLQLQNVYASRSWRITSPLRWMFRLPKHIPRIRFPSIRTMVKKPLRDGTQVCGVIAGDSLTPNGERLDATVHGSDAASKSPPTKPDEFEKNLSQRTARIYADLRNAIDLNN